MSPVTRRLAVVVLSVTFLMELRYASLEWAAPVASPIRPVSWTEDQEDLAPPPPTPLTAVPLGGALTPEGLGLPLTAGEAGLAALLAATRSDDLLRVKLGVLGLRRLRDPAGLPRVAELTEASLKDPALDGLKKQLVWTLGVLAPRTDTVRWAPLLEKHLQDPNDAVRDYAAFALARLGVASGAALTAQVLADAARKPITRGRAALALADGGFVERLPAVKAVLEASPPCELASRARRAVEVMSVTTVPR